MVFHQITIPQQVYVIIVDFAALEPISSLNPIISISIDYSLFTKLEYKSGLVTMNSNNEAPNPSQRIQANSIAAITSSRRAHIDRSLLNW